MDLTRSQGFDLAHFTGSSSITLPLSSVRCVWQSGTPSTMATIKDMPLYEEGQTMSPKSPKIPRIRLPTEIMRNLLTLARVHQPHMRPSVRYVFLRFQTVRPGRSSLIRVCTVCHSMWHLDTQDQTTDRDYEKPAHPGPCAPTTYEA